MATTDPTGRRADVYANLDRECLSILSRDTGSDDYGQVIAYHDSVLVDDPTFVIQEAGQARVRETGVRNVHAFVRGEVLGVGPEGASQWWSTVADDPPAPACALTYNPFETDRFQVAWTTDDCDLDKGTSVDEADLALVRPREVVTTGVE